MQPASQVDRQRYRVGRVIISASWKSDKGSVQCCRTLSVITAPLFIEVIQHDIFLLHISRWVRSYSQVSAFHWQQNHSRLFLSCPQLPRCHVKIKPCAAFWCSAHFALSTETQVVFLLSGGAATISIVQLWSLESKHLQMRRSSIIEVNWIECLFYSIQFNVLYCHRHKIEKVIRSVHGRIINHRK